MSRFNFIGRKRNERDPNSLRSGYVRFDERDNAIYQWHRLALEDDGTHNERLRRKALDNPTLALVDDRVEDGLSIINDQGLRMGYNPYESGVLVREEAKRRNAKDLRALSKWIEQQREMERLLQKHEQEK